jgi:hypothetical protein
MASGGQAVRAAGPSDGILGRRRNTMGPVMTDVIALLGRGAFFSAPFRNSISSACLPTFRPVI